METGDTWGAVAEGEGVGWKREARKNLGRKKVGKEKGETGEKRGISAEGDSEPGCAAMNGQHALERRMQKLA